MLAERARVKFRSAVAGSALVAAALVWSQTKPTVAQSTTPAPEATQTLDERYTQIIRQNLQDPRITTELVDHLPASDTVPTPLMFFGRARSRSSSRNVITLIRPVLEVDGREKQVDAYYFLGFNAILNWNDLDAGKASTSAGWPNAHTER